MERCLYDAFSYVENDHWWFRARRRIAQSVLDSLELPATARIMDAGCGTGGNLQLLSRYGRVSAFEPDAEACVLAKARSGIEVKKGSLPDNIPFSSIPFDIITLFDVLEHVEDDETALHTLHNRLAPGGRLLLTVPALQWLWSKHDTLNYHYRRYYRRDLVAKIEKVGFVVEVVSYINFWLLPLGIAVRMAEQLFPKQAEKPTKGLSVPPSFVNRLMYWAFSSERFLVRRLSPPLGMSLLVLARRADELPEEAAWRASMAGRAGLVHAREEGVAVAVD